MNEKPEFVTKNDIGNRTKFETKPEMIKIGLITNSKLLSRSNQ